MLFNSLSYAVFLPLACLAYYAFPQRARWAVLLVFSCYFYMSWNPELIVLIFFTTAVSYTAGRLLARTAPPAARRAILVGGVLLCLLPLFFFKYFNFLGGSVAAFFKVFGLGLTPPVLDLVLPVGISFYTFQTLSYIVDVYRRSLPAEHHFGIYALYVSFFPQLVAGPIERAGSLLPQFRRRHTFSTGQCSAGLRKIGVGLFKKIVVADYVAPFVNAVYNDLTGKTGLTLLFATLLFAVQIYCDFSGYSDIAVGSARILGFDLMENFKSPYFAASVREFWRRWHISLTSWFTDYVYIPLGGSRCRMARHLANLLITFLLSGLWHGASWTFVCWGLYHGLWLCAEQFYAKRLDALQTRHPPLRLLRTAATFVIVVLGWVFFRANSLADAGYIFQNILRGLNPLRLPEYMASAGMGLPQLAVTGVLLLALAVYDGVSYFKGPALTLLCQKRPVVRYLFYWALGASIVLALMLRPFGAAADFIYFQF